MIYTTNKQKTMKLTFLKNKNKKLSEFLKAEWKIANREHFGGSLDEDYWSFKNIRLKAEKDGKIVGGLGGHTMAGVFYISELIVDHNKRGTGIGKELINKAEAYARKNKIHLIYLETGKGWGAVKFYEKLGFKKETLLKKFHSKKDSWTMTKYL